MSKKLGNLIAKSRKEAKVKIEDLAKAISFDVRDLQNIENGGGHLPLNKAAIIARELKIQPNKMFKAVLADD